MTNNLMPAAALKTLERQKTLTEISRLYFSDFKHTWELINEKASPALNADRASIWSLSECGTKLICEDLYIRSTGEHDAGSELVCEQYPSYFKALEGSRFIDASDGVNDPRTSEFTIEYLNPLNIKSLLDVPVRKDGKLSGVVCFEYVDAIYSWTIEEKEFAASLADLVSAKFESQERSKAEEELAASEKRYRNILENALVGIFRTNQDGKFLFANPAMATILEYNSVDDLLRINAIQLYYTADDRKRLVERILEKNKIHNFEVTLVSSKGNPRDCFVNAFMEEGEIVGMILDITGQKKILNDLEDARNRAEESDRLKTSLLANMSHELRTPMNSILGFSELLLHDSEDADTIFYAKKIHGSGKRLMNTLQAILELADMETTRSKLVMREVAPLNVLASVISPFQALAGEKGLYIVTEFKEEYKAWGDENLLKLVFQNLIDNAIKFTETGGLTIESVKKDYDGKEWLTIIFKDTGIGIDSSYFSQIFQEFRQASEGYNRRFEGTGLGLTLSSKMIKLMGGNLTVESKLGLGSEFTVWLPVSGAVIQSPESQTIHFNEVQERPGQEFRASKELPLVLVVEDNEDNAEIVKLYLKSKYRIDRAPDGNTALKMAANKQYQVVLLDINLGIGMDGLKIVHELRSQNSYQDTPFIAITGYTMSEDREKIMNAGCTHYIAKPFTKSVIMHVIDHALMKIK